jgi:hypothetical protein
MAAKEMCIQNPIVKGQYGEAANPIFEVFYLDNAHGVIADFSGTPPTSSKEIRQNIAIFEAGCNSPPAVKSANRKA